MKKWIIEWYLKFFAEVLVLFIPLTYYSAEFADFIAHY